MDKTALMNEYLIYRYILGRYKCKLVNMWKWNKIYMYTYLLCKRRLRFHRKTYFRVTSGAFSIAKNGSLRLGIPWEGEHFTTTEFYMFEHSHCRVTGHFWLLSGTRTLIGRGALLSLGSGFLNYGGEISCLYHIEIGNDVLIGPHVIFRDNDGHELCGGKTVGSILIKDHVWIGMRSVILKDVEIGEGAVVAAGSVVNKNVPPHCLVAGVPARVIRENITWKDADWAEIREQAMMKTSSFQDLNVYDK